MAYDMINDLTAVTTPATTDLVEIEQGGVSYKATVAQITGAPNGGQPPAPKPQTASTDIGYWTANGVNAYTTPNISGTYAGIAFKSGLFHGTFATCAHNTDLNSFFSTTGITGMLCWRIL